MLRLTDLSFSTAQPMRLVVGVGLTSALVAGCLARPAIGPVAVPVGPGPALGTGRVEVSVHWPVANKSVQSIPADTDLLGLTIQQGTDSILATASIVRSPGQTTATADLIVSIGPERSLQVVAHSGTEVVATGQSATFTVLRNQTTQASVSLSPTIQTYAGTTRGYSGDLGPANQASLNGPWGIAFGPDGSLYESEHSGNVIRRVAPDGTIHPFLGDGTPAAATEDPADEGRVALQSRCRLPMAIYANALGDVYFTDMCATGSYLSRVRIVPASTGTRYGRLMSAGCVYTLYRGRGTTDCAAMVQDGDALAIAEQQPGRIVGLAADGTISTLLGVPGGVAGDEQPGTSVDAALATVNVADGLARDGLGNLFFSELNGQVRMLCRTAGIYYGISAQAGRVYNVIVASQTTPAEWGAAFRQIALDSAQNLYLADSDAPLVYRCSRLTGRVEILAGAANASVQGDGGPAFGALLGNVLGMAIDSRDRLYLAENDNHRIRRVHL